jgi:putative addiction module component (TIGR02574 family)
VSEHADRIVEQVLGLPDPQREEVLEKLLSRLDSERSEVAALWIEEAQRRWASYLAGESELIPAEEVFAEFKAR